MRVVLDTNILLVSIAKASKFRPIFDAFINQKFEIIVSNEILEEYQEVITNKTNSTIATNIIELLIIAPNTIKQQIFYN